MKNSKIILELLYDKIYQIICGSLLKVKKKIIRQVIKKYKIGPGAYSNVKSFEGLRKKYVLNQIKKLHLGDGINFALAASIDNSCEFELYRSLRELYESLGICIEKKTVKKISANYLLVTTIGNLTDIFQILLKKPIIIFDLMDTAIPNKIPIHLAKQLGYENVDLNTFKSDLKKKYNKLNITEDNKYILLNIEIASGLFRINYEDIYKLLSTAFDYARKKDAIVVLVGVNSLDYKKICPNDGVNLIDMRGKLSIADLVKVISSNSCIRIFSFDNLIMHIGNIFDKECNIKFRGKSTKEEEYFHFKYVNNSYREKDNITYI